MLIPVSVIVVTKNEEKRIGDCLRALQDFDEIIVVDSGSSDKTKEISENCGARVVDFKWNGQYPKKRQWILDHVPSKNPYIFFVDADEIVTPELIHEIRQLDFSAAGYFVKGRYVFEGHELKFGLKNNKLVLFDRNKIEFPVVDDLDLAGMGEIEGHYQPVLKVLFQREIIGQLRCCLLHRAYEDARAWQARHERYAQWEVDMNVRKAWPNENSRRRRILKELFRAMPFRPFVAFIHCYVLKAGFLDGAAGFRFALSRGAYYLMISRASRNQAQLNEVSTPRFVAEK